MPALELTDLAQLRADLRARPQELTDDEVCQCVNNHLISHSAETAAKGYLAATASACYFRPHLAAQLLHLPVAALVAVGVQRADDFLRWVEASLRRAWLSREVPLLERYAGAEGVAWLRIELPHLEVTIQRIFEEEVQKVQIGVDELAERAV